MAPDPLRMKGVPLACPHVLTSTTRYIAFHGPDHDLEAETLNAPRGRSQQSRGSLPEESPLCTPRNRAQDHDT